MKKKALSIIGLLTMSAGLLASVPYSFTPNTPAKASEVNENFQVLSDKFDRLENNVTNNTNSIETAAESENCYNTMFPYTYEHIPSNIGDTITLGGIEYIIVAIPFIEHGTGDRYYIKQPKLKSTSDSYSISLVIQYNTTYVEQGTQCYQSNYFGFPSTETGIQYSNGYLAYIYDPDSTNSKFNIDKVLSFSSGIKINQTNFHIYSRLSKSVQETPLSAGDVDLRDDIDWSVLDVNTSLVDNFKTLLNHIEIVKIEP